MNTVVTHIKLSFKSHKLNDRQKVVNRMRVYAYADLEIVAQTYSIDNKKQGGWCILENVLHL